MPISKLIRVSSLLCAAVLLGPLAFGQSQTTGQIRGTVTDPSGAGVPDTNLSVKDLATGLVKTATSGASGGYTFLNLQAGTYEITASKTGFNKAVYSNIVVDAARTTDQPISLQVGSVSSTVEVTGVAPVLQTSSNQIATTVTNKDVQDLPMSGRDTLPFALLMAGSQSVYGGSTFDGLPNASLDITLDGMNNNSQRFKSGGTSFYQFAPARLDAIDEITIATTGSGADASGTGAMEIKTVTQRGTDQYHFKLFEQFRNEDLNANSFINNARGLPVTKLRENDFGGNIGGPLPIPFVPYFKHKLFFFINFEATPLPSSTVENATLLTPPAQSGNFSYIGTDHQVHTVNVLGLAGANGYPSTIDPTVAGMLSTINGAVGKGVLQPSTTNLYQQTLQWNQATNTTTYYPTARLDYQITPKVAWHGTWNLRHENIAGTPNYPGFSIPGGAYKINAYVATNTVDWTITPNMLNTAMFGVQSNGEYFYKGTSIQQWEPYGNRYVPLGLGITDIVPDETPYIRNNPVYQFTDNLNWIKGKHTIAFGASWLHSSFYETTWSSPGYGGGVPLYGLGIDPSDPVNSVFSPDNFPAIGSNDLSTAAQLYATLTGRLNAIYGANFVDEKSHQYSLFASSTQRFAYTTSGVYAQDSFHVTNNFTVNYGLRWQFTTPVSNTNGIDLTPDLANFWGPSPGPFAPGVLTGPQDPQLTLRPSAYSADYKQPAPNVGFAWNPKFDSGILGALLGHGTVIRSSYGINFYDEGMNAISNVLSSNPGNTQYFSLYPGEPGFTPGSLTLSSSIPPLPGFPASFTPTLPESEFAFSTGYQTVNPDLRVPYVQNWNFGIQRQLSPSTVLEVRYVGNKSTHMWHYYNAEETNIFENGFLSEFKNAQNNLAINQAAGVNSFANRGLPGQVALPVMQTAFSSSPSAFRSGAFITDLKQGQAGAFANTLAANIPYYCALVGTNFGPCVSNGFTNPGSYPINFFQPNPYGTSLMYQDDNGNSNYNGLQIEVRKSTSHGLAFNLNYTYSHTLGNLFNSNDQTATSQERTLRDDHLDYGPTPFDIRHVFQAYWTYSLPVGRGRALNLSNGVLNSILGGWTLSGIHRVTSGHVFILGTATPFSGTNPPGYSVTPYQTFNNLTDSGVVLNGITTGQLQSMLDTIGSGPNKNITWVNPALIGPDGRANPKYVAPATTPGVLGSLLYLYGPNFFSTDMALEKIFPIKEHLKFGFQVEALNVFNHPVWSIGNVNYVNITSTSFGQTTTQTVGPRNLQLRAYLEW